jgi:hypothetical protein
MKSLQPRVLCPQHGVRVAAVPWAGHDARFTCGIEDQVAVQAGRQAVIRVMRISWDTVGAILSPVPPIWATSPPSGRRSRGLTTYNQPSMPADSHMPGTLSPGRRSLQLISL